MKNKFIKSCTLTLLILSYLHGQADVLIMSPEPNSEISSDEVLIAVSLISIPNVDPNTIRVLLDGMDITDQAYIDSDMISCYLESIEPGNHEVDLIANGISEPIRWDFSSFAGESNVQYSGKIRSGTSIDMIDGQDPLNVNKITLNFNGSAYDWLKLKTNLKITSQENAIYQPRNVYGFSLGLKENVLIKVGDSNPRISNYTMGGKRIRGVDIALKYWWFDLRLVHGEINRAVQGDPSYAYSYSIENNSEGEKYLSLDRSGYTFRQMGSALRFALGRKETFQWGLNFMKAIDDVSSVDTILTDAQVTYFPDANNHINGLDSGVVYTINDLGTKAQILDPKYWSGSGPKDNIIVGSDIGLNLFNKRFRIDGEIAFSLTNNNIWDGPITLSGLDTLVDDSLDNQLLDFNLDSIPDPEEYETILIINQNLNPLIPIDINVFDTDSNIDWYDALLSMPSLAYRGRMIANFFGNYLSLEYGQVGPEFNSLANPYLVKNKREWSITDKFKLFKNRLMFNIGYKYQDNDILTTIDNVNSQNTISLGFNAVPGPGLPTVNFTYRSINRENGITQKIELTDSTFTDNREMTRTDNIMVNFNHRFDLIWDHTLSGTFVNIEKSDEYEDRDLDFVSPSMSTQVINFSISTRYDFPLSSTLNITTNSSELSTGPGQRGVQDFLTSNLILEFPLFKNKLSIKSGLNYARGLGMVDTSWLGFKGGVRWRIAERIGLNAQGEFRSKETAGETKNSIIARANLEYAF